MRDLTRDSPARHLVALALPLLAGNLVQQLYNLTDSLVVGNALGKIALAAVGTSLPVMFSIGALGMGFTMGVGILVGRSYGARDWTRLHAAVRTSAVTLAAGSLVLGLGGLALVPRFLRLLGTPAPIEPLAASYLRIILGGMPVAFAGFGVSAVLRGLGDTRTPLALVIVATIINIALDLLFVLVFGWGVPGVAWATLIAQLAVAVLGAGSLARQLRRLPQGEPGTASLRHAAGRAVLRESVAIGLPAGLQQLLVGTGLSALTAIVNPFGPDAVAALAIGGRVETFVLMPSMSFSLALTAFVAQNLGAGRPERVRSAHAVAQWLSAAVALSVTAGVLLAARPITRAFNSDPEVIRMGVALLRTTSGFYIFFSAMFVTSGLIRGAGDTLFTLLTTFLAMWVVRLPVAWLAGQTWGPTGVWWGIPTGFLVGAAVNTLYYRSGRWTRRGHRQPVQATDGTVAGEGG